MSSSSREFGNVEIGLFETEEKQHEQTIKSISND